MYSEKFSVRVDGKFVMNFFFFVEFFYRKLFNSNFILERWNNFYGKV